MVTGERRIVYTEPASPTADTAVDVVGPVTGVVVNPTKVTDLARTKDDIRVALAEHGWPEPSWWETTPADTGRGQTRGAIDSGALIVFALGGDGTVRACATELAGSDVALAVLPVGTGNLLARNLGLPTDLAAALAVAVDGGTRRIDVGMVDDECFTVMGGMGFDADMMGDAPETVKARIGWPAYVLSALRHLFDRPIRVEVTLDDGPPIQRRARTVLVGNVGQLQGGLAVLPDAEPDDGLLDVAILAPRTLLHWAALAGGVLLRRQRIPARETYRAKRIRVDSDRAQSRELDGDVIAPARCLHIDIRPQALTVCVPDQATSTT
jgi:YegS/Rv2252/BmrU family lipid kinase